MDLIISVDTSVAHLAGALGKDVYILLPYHPDYRWLLNRKDSPWYPTCTLFRKSKIDDWSDVVLEIKSNLQNTLI
jgi:ADP-heptose:LPS heptosyltransferase